MNKILVEFDLPGKEFYEENENKVKKIKEDIENLWKKCEEKDIDCEEIIGEVELLEGKVYDFISFHSLIPILKKNLPIDKDFLYDIKYLFISEEYFKLMKEYDLRIFKIIFGDRYNEDYLLNQVNMAHLMSGFTIDKDLSGNRIKIYEGAIRKKEENE